MKEPEEYFEIIDEFDKPATPKQRQLWGSSLYGYKTQQMAEKHCPNDCVVRKRYKDQYDDWPGNVVASRDAKGYLVRHV